MQEYRQIAMNNPLWFQFFNEIVVNELSSKIGAYAPMFTLLATVFNRWMAIALPKHYPRFMRPRLIFLYCLLCYLLALLNDPRLIDMLPLASALQLIIFYLAPLILPSLLSIVLSISIFRTLSK